MTPDRSTVVGGSATASLRRFAQPGAAVERCQLCAVELPQEHEHLVDPAHRQLLCACEACALLFPDDGTARYRRVGKDVYAIAKLDISEAHWNRLEIPIGLCFIFRSSADDRVVAVYPSPAGPTESPVEAAAFDALAAKNPMVGAMRRDTQALLLYHVNGAGKQYLAPIDQCYALVGLIRCHWHGISGGAEARQVIKAFFEQLDRRARPMPTPTLPAEGRA